MAHMMFACTFYVIPSIGYCTDSNGLVKHPRSSGATQIVIFTFMITIQMD